MSQFAFISVLVTIWILKVHSVYHELTMMEFKPATTRTNISFGYSVAYQPKTKKLVVGAPKGSSIGQIFECNIGAPLCSEVFTSIKHEDENTNFWLGATVATGQDFSVACAPRFVESRTKLGTFGRCYIKNELSAVFTKMKLLNDSDKEPKLEPYEKYMDSFGWSLNVDNMNSIIVGGPAMYTGRVLVYADKKAYPQLVRGDVWNVDYTFGYSVTSGLFKSVNETLYAISSPYGVKGLGKIILTDGHKGWALEQPIEFKPPVGSLFGAAMCSAKLRGPGQRESLLIGAPTYAQKGQMNRGIVYVYFYNLEKQGLIHQKTILGTVNGGQFGSALLSLGDLNGDKRDEVAISAPYEDGGLGAVYIYSAAEITRNIPPSEIKWLQKIKPKGYHTFGHSLAIKKDDINTACNQLAIGAPGSDKVLFLRCIPQIRIIVQNLEEHKTPRYPRARRNETLFEFNSCVKVEYPDRPIVIKADITVKVSLIHPTATIADSKNDGSKEFVISTLFEKYAQYCFPVDIILPLDSSYEPVIQYQVTATQVNNPLEAKVYDSRHAMVSDLSLLTLTDTLWVADCSGDHECVSELSFHIVTSLSDGYIIGSSDTETVAVSVHNIGDVAYTSCIVVNLIGVGVRSRPAGCTRDSAGDIVCIPQQPIKNNSNWHSGMIELETKSLKSDIKEITIKVIIYSNCKLKLGRREKSKDIILTTDPSGLSMKDSISFGDENIFLTTTELETTGKQISHIYNIINNGVTVWAKLICDIVYEKKPYFKELKVTIDTEVSYKCDEVRSNDQQQFFTRCIVSELRRNHTFNVIMSIKLEPGTLEPEILEKENTTLSSSLTLGFDDNKLQHSIKSILKMKEAVVPLWVIIAATLVGILIMIIIAIALYECGFLRRKNKEKLKELKQNVHRQSMRRSMSARESARAEEANKPADKEERLDEVPLVKSPPTHLPEDKLPEIRPLSADVNLGISESTAPNEEKKRKELIILGLQKNLGANNRPQALPKPTRPKPSDEINF